ncbi:MAG: hypothetical protein CVT81_04450 [Alphaproteobacteria bacterium HGW-Alphaproteobacteria-3]|nr:MAG: hypothetical protein CVT81_04450 [Alphaproteobacteria bacterium HGW-Alphaproteobacteria-3]
MRIVFFAALFAIAASALPARSAVLTPPEIGYSATRIVNTGGNEISGKLYSQDRNERWEMSVQGMRQVSILQHDAGRAFLYMPDMNMAMTMNTADAEKYGVSGIFTGIEAEEAGRDNVNGEGTTRYRIAPNPKNGNTEAMLWITDDGIPVKAEGQGSQGTFSMELKDLKRGPQEASLFRLPDGVTPMTMPAGLPGMMQGRMPPMPAR